MNNPSQDPGNLEQTGECLEIETTDTHSTVGSEVSNENVEVNSEE